jgi:hypothetical protein
VSKPGETCVRCNASTSLGRTEERERHCGTFRLGDEASQEVNYVLGSQFSWTTTSLPWLTAPLYHTAGLHQANLHHFIPLVDLFEGELSAPQLAEHAGRPRAKFWACDGTQNFFSETTPLRRWSVVILLSYPVNDRNFALSAGGEKVCKTLKAGFSSLGKIPDHARHGILITDIYPYVGHASGWVDRTEAWTKQTRS